MQCIQVPFVSLQLAYTTCMYNLKKKGESMTDVIHVEVNLMLFAIKFCDRNKNKSISKLYGRSLI